MAGFVGVVPWSLSLADLVEMNEGRDRGLWWHTASVEAMVANTVRDPKKRRKPWSAIDFHVYEISDRQRRAKAKRGKLDISILKAVFVDGLSKDQVSEKFGV